MKFVKIRKSNVIDINYGWEGLREKVITFLNDYEVDLTNLGPNSWTLLHIGLFNGAQVGKD